MTTGVMQSCHDNLPTAYGIMSVVMNDSESHFGRGRTPFIHKSNKLCTKRLFRKSEFLFGAKSLGRNLEGSISFSSSSLSQAIKQTVLVYCRIPCLHNVFTAQAHVARRAGQLLSFLCINKDPTLFEEGYEDCRIRLYTTS